MRRRLPRHRSQRDVVAGPAGRRRIREGQVAELDVAADLRLRRPAVGRPRRRRSSGTASSTSSIRFHDAMPRCSMFVTQPNAIIGQLSIIEVGVERDELADA